MPLSSRAVYRGFQAAIAAYVFALVLAMYFHTMDPTGDVKRLLSAWGAVLLGGGWLIAAWRHQIPLRRPRLFFEVVLLLLAVLAVASLRSAYAWYSLTELSYFVALAMIYFVAAQVYRDVDEIRLLMLAICGAVAVAAMYAFLQSAGVDPFPWEDRSSDVYSNLPATYGNPNYAAHMLILAILMSLYLAATWRVEALLFTVAFATHLVFTDQRAGWLALGAGLGVVLLGFLVQRVLKHPVRSAVVSILLAGVLGVCALAGGMLVTKQRTGSAFPLDVSLLIRYQSYVSASDMILDAPLLGHGPGVYGLAYPKYWTGFEQEWFAQEGRMNAHVHNDLMELAIDGGLPAAGLYLALLVLGMAYGLTLAFTAGPRSRRALGYFFAAFFAAFAVDGLFGFNLRVPISAAAFFLMLGALDGLWSPRAQAGAATAPRRGPRLALLAAVAAAACFAVLEARGFAASYQWKQGRTEEAKRHDDKAIGHYEYGLQLTPWNWNFERRMGHLQFDLRHYEQAETHFARSLELNPDYFLTNLPLSNTRLVLAREMIRANPDAIDPTLDKLREATENANALLAICPVYAPAEAVLGRIASVRAVYNHKHPDPAVNAQEDASWLAAEQHFLRAIDLGAAVPSALYRMTAEVRKAREDYSGAEEMLVRAAQTNPADNAVWIAFLELAAKHGRHERLQNTLYEQIDALRQAETVDNDALTTLYLMLANVIENGDRDLDAAERAYLAAAETGAARPELWTNFARFATVHDRRPALAKAVRHAAVTAEQEGIAALPQVQAVAAVLQEPVSSLAGASLLLVSSVRGHAPQEDAMTARQAYGWAADWMNGALAAAPAQDDSACTARLNLGIVYATLRQYAQAEELFRRADACIAPDQRPFLAVHRANALIEMERATEGVAMLRDAVATDPDSFDLRCAYARALAKTGFSEEAREQYNLLLEQPDLSAPGRAMVERERGLL